jgi:hypothetical protein
MASLSCETLPKELGTCRDVQMIHMDIHKCLDHMNFDNNWNWIKRWNTSSLTRENGEK